MLESILFKSFDGEDVENERKYIDTMYNEELNYHSLTNKIDTLKVILNENIVECFDDILKCVKGQQHQLMMMPNIVSLLKLLLVNPATFATAERSFSLTRRLKTWMGSTMLPDCNCYFTRTQNIDRQIKFDRHRQRICMP